MPQQQRADHPDVGQPGGRARRARTVARRRGPDDPVRSSTASATIDASTQMTPSTITPSFSAVGVVMNRVSTSMRADRPGWAATLQFGEHAGDLRLLLGGQRAGGAGDADEVGANPADVGPDVQRAAGAGGDRRPGRHRGDGVTERDDDGVGVGGTNSPLRVASMPPGGMVEKTRPPAAGRVAIVRQGMDTSRACGAPDTSGAVTSVIRPSGPAACGHRMVAVVCLTGSSGTSPHSTTPAMPATTAMRRAMRWAGTRLDGRRRT